MHRLLLIVLALLIAPALGAQDKREFDDIYREAIAHVGRAEWQLAEQKLQLAIKMNPDTGRGKIRRRLLDRDDYFPEYYLGIVYLNTGRPVDAKTQFDRARARDINLRQKEFQQLPSLEARAATAIEADAKKRAVPAGPDPRQQFKNTIDSANKLLASGQYDNAERVALEARKLNVDNEAADAIIENARRGRANARLQEQLKGSPSLAELRRLLTEYADTGVSLDEVKRRIAAGEAVERRTAAERTAMIAFYSGNYTQSISALADAEKAAPLSTRGHLYRALSLASQATRGKTINQGLLQQAKKSWALASQRPDDFKADLRYISPQLLQLLR